MADNNVDYPRIRWACRRGMLELDLILLPFFEQHFTGLTPAQQQIFVQLLTEPDPDLLNWLMGHEQPADTKYNELIAIIKDASHYTN